MKRILAALILSFASIGVAYSHTHLLRSEPAEKSILMTEPKNLVLEFAKPIKLTALALHRGEAKLQELGPLPADASSKITIGMPGKLDPGTYTVRFRGVSEDQHFMSGKLTFTLRAKQPPAP